MVEKINNFDFHYAISRTEIILAPRKHLETFGNTIVNYTHIATLMDDAGRVRVREGRLQALRPQIISPSSLGNVNLEGFGEEAQKYISYLRDHEDSIRILRYGYTLKQEAFSEELITDSKENVLSRVKEAVKAKDDPFSAIVTGIDDPWDVSLVRLFWVITTTSAPHNILEMQQHHLFDHPSTISPETHEEIERAFTAAAQDPSLIKSLGSLLQKHNLFARYQDRFFALIRHTKGGN